MTEGRLKTIGVVALCAIAIRFGMFLEHRLGHHQIECTDQMQASGRTIDACSLGCRTEDDVACSRFVDLVRGSAMITILEWLVGQTPPSSGFDHAWRSAT